MDSDEWTEEILREQSMIRDGLDENYDMCCTLYDDNPRVHRDTKKDGRQVRSKKKCSLKEEDSDET